MAITCRSINELPDIAKSILDLDPNNRLFLFKAEMGGGKTTLIREICNQLHIEDQANSPTFSIVNEYYSPTFGTIYHFDFYRIKSIQEAFDFGYEDYIFSDNYCFIEWPDKLEDHLPISFIEVCIKLDQQNNRIIKVSKR